MVLLNTYGLLAVQLISYILLIISPFYLSLDQYLITLLFYVLIVGFGISAGMHRLISHKSYKTSKLKEQILSILGCLAFQGSPIVWACTHRSHHKHSDQEKDPHSPRNGWFNAFFMSSLSAPNPMLVKGLLRNKFQTTIHLYYWYGMVLYTGILMIVSFDLFLTICAVPIALGWLSVNLINTVCHGAGEQKHDTKDDSTNFLPLALLIFGEGYHNNHHNKCNNPRFGKYDLGYLFCLIMSDKQS